MRFEYFSFSLTCVIVFIVEHINQSKITFVFVFSLFMRDTVVYEDAV